MAHPGPHPQDRDPRPGAPASHPPSHTQVASSWPGQSSLLQSLTLSQALLERAWHQVRGCLLQGPPALLCMLSHPWLSRHAAQLGHFCWRQRHQAWERKAPGFCKAGGASMDVWALSPLWGKSLRAEGPRVETPSLLPVWPSSSEAHAGPCVQTCMRASFCTSVIPFIPCTWEWPDCLPPPSILGSPEKLVGAF